jgi:hypothetical protein
MSKPIARVSEVTPGGGTPAYRCAHAGYDRADEVIE